MPYVPFHERFPEVAAKETRTITFFKPENSAPGELEGEFGFVELYCDEVNCDCRRVFLNVIERASGDTKAVITFGWESKEFYTRWLTFNDPLVVQELKGPALNSASYQSQLAPALLKEVKEVLLTPDYVERLKRHYAMFRATVAGEPRREIQKMMPYVGPKRIRGNRKKR